jgi:hypothetical protein
LGAPTIKVEVDDAVWDKIFSMAFRWFKAKKGVVKIWIQPLIDGQNCYPLPPGGFKVVDVIMPRSNDIAAYLTLGFFDIIPAQGLGFSSGSASTLNGFYSGYVQLLQSLETRRRVFNADPDWEQVGNQLIISGGGGTCSSIMVPSSSCAGCGSVSGDISGSVSGMEFDCDVPVGLGMLVYYKTNDFVIEDLIGRDEDLIYRFVLAQVKKILGRIRSKYKSYPAAGGMVDTDGPELIEEARLEMEILEEEISESQGSMGFIVG